MKTQQQAEKEEQQRIKSLVLNYDLQQSEDQEGESMPPQSTHHRSCIDASTGSERPATFHHNRIERPSKDRGQRIRKLQLSDVDW